jgi:hypothetical protein
MVGSKSQAKLKINDQVIDVKENSLLEFRKQNNQSSMVSIIEGDLGVKGHNQKVVYRYRDRIIKTQDNASSFALNTRQTSAFSDLQKVTPVITPTLPKLKTLPKVVVPEVIPEEIKEDLKISVLYGPKQLYGTGQKISITQENRVEPLFLELSERKDFTENVTRAGFNQKNFIYRLEFIDEKFFRVVDNEGSLIYGPEKIIVDLKTRLALNVVNGKKRIKVEWKDPINELKDFFYCLKIKGPKFYRSLYTYKKSIIVEIPETGEYKMALYAVNKKEKSFFLGKKQFKFERYRPSAIELEEEVTF